MTTSKVVLATRISKEAMQDFDLLAKSAGLDRSAYLQAWIGQIRKIKRENALAAITSIPVDLLKGSPGRPSNEEAFAPYKDS